uniref:Tr-type G domain-containing protein n=1 Tax=Brassica oleracea var. oleracea TaxID=109376 RepID=A0A0D3B4B8_BRAOL
MIQPSHVVPVEEFQAASVKIEHRPGILGLGSSLIKERPNDGGRESTCFNSHWWKGSSLDPNRLRNVAVIAHVDHGKTTLMDRLLRQCGADIPHERAMDSINLERERGITISSKVTSVFWKENELNMVDTPGHADFGGEVERVVGMVEGAILVVDAGEGPLAQTKFVLAKALKYGLRPILLLNKVDRPSVSEERCDDEVESLVFDLFANLGATEEQLDFPVLYASAKEGWASSTFTKEPPADARNMSQLLDAVVKHVPPPKADLDAPFLMLVSMMEKDFYLGRILTGRVSSGVVRAGDKVTGLRNTDSGSVKIEEGKVVKLMKKKGTTIVSIDAAGAGDIICMAGLTTPSIGHTVASTEVTTALPSVELDPPTISMTFGVNDSPLAGRDGTQLTGGELQLGILIENMRREGFELSVSPPKVILTIIEFRERDKREKEERRRRKLVRLFQDWFWRIKRNLIELIFCGKLLQSVVKVVVTVLQRDSLGYLVNPTVRSSLLELKFGGGSHKVRGTRPLVFPLRRVTFPNRVVSELLMENMSRMISLNGANYHLWKGKMEDLLFVKEFHVPVFEEQKPEKKTDEEWKLQHRQVCGLIRQWVDDNVLHHIETETDARSLWKKMEQLYARKTGNNKMYMIKKLIELRYKTEDKQRLEPIEEVTIEINEEHVGLVMEALSHRRAEVIDMCPVPGNDEYEKYRGPLGNVRKGVLSYDGMIIGEHSRDTDLDVNPVKAKELTNIRSVNKDENVKLSPPRLMTLEEAIGYVASDELIEVTPKTIRLRKKCLDVTKRKSQSKRAKE